MIHIVTNSTITCKILKIKINEDRNGVFAEAGSEAPRIRTRKKRRKKYSKRIRIFFNKKYLNTESLVDKNMRK
jgi:hypothetical protein